MRALAPSEETHFGSETLEGIVAFRTSPWSLSSGGVTERITGATVSGNYFEVLGVKPALGAGITHEDDQKPGSGGSRGPVVVLSHRLWLRRFGGDPSVVGSRVFLNGHPFTVVGVAPEGFGGTEVGQTADAFAPMTMQPVLLPENANALTQRRNVWLRMMGRLKTGGAVRAAEAELTALLRRFNEETIRAGGITDPSRRRSLLAQRIALPPGNAGLSGLRRQYSDALVVLMAVTALVLLIACANVASLLSSRAAARQREIAIRLGLGAARVRLVSQLLTESLLLALAGGASGLLLARWLRDLLLGYLPSEQELSAPLDHDVLLFTCGVAVATGLLFGLMPAIQSTKVDVAPALKGESMAARATRVLFRRGLVVVQISLSCLLLCTSESEPMRRPSARRCDERWRSSTRTSPFSTFIPWRSSARSRASDSSERSPVSSERSRSPWRPWGSTD